MNDIKNILNDAKKAIDLIDNGKTYTTSYVVDRLSKAADDSPGDQLISHMRDVVAKAAKGSDYVTQKQIGELYNQMIGLSGGRTSFREKLGDMLPENHNVVSSSSYDYSKNRAEPGRTMDLSSEDISSAAESFASIFSLKEGSKPGLYSKSLADRAKNMVSLQFNSLGCYPSVISVASQNDHYLLCSASFDSSDWSNVTVKVPVQITDGIVREPTSFVDSGKLAELTKENLYPYMKEQSMLKSAKNTGSFSDQRRMDSIKLDNAITPAGLEDLTDIDSTLVAAASKFSTAQVNNARSIVVSELSSVGIANSQVNVNSATDRSINFSARIPTGSGGVDVIIPVEVVSGTPIIPSKMLLNTASGEEVYDFNEKSFHTIVANNTDSKSNSIVRDSGKLSFMSYHELVDNMINGVSSGDYRLAEDSLVEVEKRFGSDMFLAALEEFKSLLKTSSKITNFDDSVIKRAFADGHIINTPNSVEPYCPALGLPLSKISFDERGRPIPRRSGVKSENLRQSGAGILTSKIVIT
mgnify:CR=1 FL=1|tara:strand:+ start:5673 stop:7247 length:1575 start_codon:yes stop_codon:yes gene_type:complete